MAGIRKKRILLIESNELQRKMFVQIASLEDGTYDVIACKDALMALTHLANADRSPDLVISDWKVPGGGIEFFKTLSKMGLRSICVTTTPLEAIKGIKIARLPIPVVEKPFDVYKMLTSVDAVLLTDIKNSAAIYDTF